MSEKKLLTSEELKTLESYGDEMDKLTLELGQIDIQKAILEGKRTELLGKIANVQEKSNKTAKSLQDKYGDGNINLETGEFSPIN
jgi:hypothetical protein